MKSTALLLAVLLAAAPARALEWHTMGPRALGMGGAGVAATQGPIASYWNPAALGRATSNAYGVQIPFGVHAALTGSVVEGAKNLKELKDACASGGTCTNAQIADALDKLNDPGNGLRVDAGVGLNVKVGKLALFTNGYLDMGAVPQVDTANRTTVTIANNTSKLIVKGANITEFGAGYGHEIPPLPGLYLGGNLKLISANVGYADYAIISNNNDQGNIVSALKNGAKRSANFGVDLAALWDLDRSFGDVPLKPRFGLIGRNLNNPSFRQPDAAVAAGATSKFKINPQVRFGASIQPFNWWTIAADADLTRNLTPVDRVASRQLGIGSEFNVFNRDWINIPLRVGLMRNTAETSAGTVITAGAGLNFLHVMFDISAAVSNRRVTTQSANKETKIPREVGLAAQLSVLFGGADDEAPARTSRPERDDQPVPTEKIKQASDKAHDDLKVEELKQSGEKPAAVKP
jgi:hypothetical protein